MNARPQATRAFFLLCVALPLVAAAAHATVAEVPYLSGRVVDTAEVLSADASARISELLKAHEASSGNQVVVLTLPSLADESVEDFAERVFRAWQLGQAGKDNGVLIAIAVEDRRLRIEVGYGLEGTLTDLAAGRIIRGVITPRFRAGDYDGGIEAGVSAVIGVLTGTGEVPAEVEPVAEAAPSGFHMEGPDLSIMERILFGAFIFGIIGLFTVLGVVTPSGGWFLYPFLIPFWAAFPIVVVGVKGALILLISYLVLFPIAKILVSRAPWYGKARKELKTKGKARIGGFTFGGGSSSSSSGSSSWSSGGSSFSGGGGHSGGGGSSGSW
jgi:uncharacterized protein